MLLLGTTATVLVLAFVFHLGVAATVAAVLIGLPGLWMAWVPYRNDARKAQDTTSLPGTADRLAVAVKRQWENEASVRRLNEPYPLPVSWSEADHALTDDWNVMEKLARSGAGWPVPTPEKWAAGPDELGGKDDELPGILARIPTRRLVVLGEPGSGKTMLMVRLVLDMLKTRQPGDPVPFLVPLASWNPEKQGLHRWLAAQLTVSHPSLAGPGPADGGTYAEALLTAGLIMPVLDGLDEVPDAVRRPAIAHINDALRPGEAAVVTCRAEEYRNAVRPPAGPEVTLRAAAAVQLEPLSTTTVADYLVADAGGPVAKGRWKPVLAVLGSGAPVALALTTPLMAGLARVIYNPRPGERTEELRNPAELCEPELADQKAVEAHLFDAFIPAAYRSASRWTAQRAEPWLGFLAHHLETTIRGSDLAWWLLRKSTPGLPTSTLYPGLPTSTLTPDLPTLAPSRGLRLRPTGLLIGVLAGPLFGLAFVEVFLIWLPGLNHHHLNSIRGWQIAVGVGFTLSFAAGGGVTAVHGDLEAAASPGELLLRDRLISLAEVLALALLAGGAGLIVGPAAGISGKFIFLPPVTGAVLGLVLASTINAWPPYTFARVLLAVCHRLPWPLMSFLEDAHQRGVLRQAGAVYQFRHIELQHRLAARWKDPLPRWQRWLKSRWAKWP